jgi:hypothetical protein
MTFGVARTNLLARDYDTYQDAGMRVIVFITLAVLLTGCASKTRSDLERISSTPDSYLSGAWAAFADVMHDDWSKNDDDDDDGPCPA